MSIAHQELLCNNQYAPITSSIGFFEMPCDQVVNQFIKWQEEIRKAGHFIKRIDFKYVTGGLEQQFQALLPLKTISPNRHLFVGTSNGWTAYFNNGYRGTDPTVISFLPQRLFCRSVWIVVHSHEQISGEEKNRNRSGTLIFEMYGHEKIEWLNLIRRIRLENDMGKWHFEQAGQPLSFEQTERYQLRKKTDRFDFQLLKEYLNNLGLSPFDSDFYCHSQDRKAVLIEITMKNSDINKDISLETARRINEIE